MRRPIAMVAALMLAASGCAGDSTPDTDASSATQAASTVPLTAASSMTIAVTTTEAVATTSMATTVVEPTTTNVVPNTTTIPVVTVVRPEGAYVFNLDSGRPTTGRLDLRPGLHLLPDGRMSMMYGVDTVLRRAECTDATCAEWMVTDLIDVAPYAIRSVYSGVRGDGESVALVFGSRDDPQAGYEERHWAVWCDDPSCHEVGVDDMTERVAKEEFGEGISSRLPPSMVATADGRMGIFFWYRRGLESHQIRFIDCSDGPCSPGIESSTLVLDLPADPWASTGSLAAAVDREGIPSIIFGADDLNEANLFYVRCLDWSCSRSEAPIELERLFQGSISFGEELFFTADGSVVLTHASRPPGGSLGIRVTVCTDARCADVTTRAVYEFAPGSFSPFDATLGEDGMVRLAWTTTQGFQFARCLDVLCRDLHVTDTGVRASRPGVAIREDGLAVIGVLLAPIEPRPGDPADGVYLVWCGDEDCTVWN